MAFDCVCVMNVVWAYVCVTGVVCAVPVCERQLWCLCLCDGYGMGLCLCRCMLCLCLCDSDGVSVSVGT